MNDWESLMENGKGLPDFNLDMLIQKMTRLETIRYEAEIHAGHPRAQEEEKRAQERILSLLESFSKEIITYNIEELIQISQNLSHKINNVNVVCIKPLLIRTLKTLEEKVGEKENENERKRGKHFR